MAAASSRDASGSQHSGPDWMVALAHRIDSYRRDWVAAESGRTEEQLGGSILYRGQGVVFEKIGLTEHDTWQDLRLLGSMAVSFTPQRFIGYVLGRPVMAAMVIVPPT